MKINFKNLYTADFETTSASQYEIDGYTRVWSYGLCNLENPKEKYFDGTNIKEFMDLALKSSKKGLGYFKKREIYFHNLKFDGQFIIYYLNENGYKLFCPQDREETPPKNYTMLMDDRGALYSISVKVDSKREVIFRDSLKLLNFSVSQIADAFEITLDGLRITKHNEDLIDYNKYRGLDYKPTKKESYYQFKDCYIMACALKDLFNFTGLKKATIASMAMAYYKSKGLPKYSNFGDLYPNLTFECWDFCKLGYNGGWCYANPINSNKVFKSELKNYCGFGIDVNSMYPYIMDSKPLPYGEPFHFFGAPPDNVPLYIIRIYVNGDLKEGYLPYFRLNQFENEKGNYYEEHIEGYITLTNIDYKILLEFYEIEKLEIIEGYSFKATNILFKEYISYWYNVKKTATSKVMRTIAKLFLNSLYGKFGANYLHINKYSLIDDLGEFKDVKTEPKIDTKLSYIPVAVFITSYARAKIITDSIKLGFERHLYTDTDSIKFKLDFDTLEEAQNYCISKNIKIDSNELGAYKVENLFKECKFIRAKTYTYIDDMHEYSYKEALCLSGFLNKNSLFQHPSYKRVKFNYLMKLYQKDFNILACGAPQKSKDLIIDILNREGLESFDYGLIVGGKLMPKRVKGGSILIDTTFKINKSSYFLN